MPLMPAAVEALSELAADGPPAVRRAAANDLITHGRRQPKLDIGQGESVDRYTINIVQFELGAQAEVGASGVQTIQHAIGPPPDDDVLDVEAEGEDESDPLLEVSIKDFSGD